MFSKKLMMVAGTLAIALIIGLVGCSGDDKVVVTQAADNDDLTDDVITESNYFPLEEGFLAAFKVTSSNGDVQYVTWKIGEAVSFKGQNARYWYSYDANGVDTSFLVNDAEGVYYYSHVNDTPERILEYPLEVGKSWERFTDLGTGTGDDDYGNDIGGDDGKGDDPDDNDGGGIVLGKDVPFSGDATMDVIGVETVQTSDGQQYANAYIVKNALGDTRENRYWYVDGVGLVKFEIGIQSGQPSASKGELVAYGYPN